MPDAPQAPELKRSLSLTTLTLYGLGTTVGAGIYALTGEVAGQAGMAAPISFVFAAALAALSALSFGELSSRYPFSAGEALYIRHGLGRVWLGTLVGLLVVAAGLVSAATVTNGFVGYAAELVSMPRSVGIVGMLALLGLVAAWGIGESVRVAATITIVELSGLLVVVWSAREALGGVPERLPEIWLDMSGPGALAGVLGGGLLAFYAFLGFEDMVNVVEEVRGGPRTLPRAILVTLLVTAVLYVLIVTASVTTVPPHELAESDAPLALVFERASGRGSQALSAIGVLAMVNGALIQIIMASRVFYGLARQGALPMWLARIDVARRTPARATVVAVAITMVLALWLPLAPLAAATSLITLVIFALVNLSLWRLKGRAPAPVGGPSLPRWVPLGGFVVSAAFVAYALARFAT